MHTTIQKWGNSHAIRIPKYILDSINLRENDQVEIDVETDRIIIKRTKNKYMTLKERLAGYSGDYKCGEWDTGKPVGREVW